MRRTNNRKRNKINLNQINRETLKTIALIIVLLIVFSFVYFYFIRNIFIKKNFEKEYTSISSLNEDSPFSLNKIILFSSATITSNGLNNSVWNQDNFAFPQEKHTLQNMSSIQFDSVVHYLVFS